MFSKLKSAAKDVGNTITKKDDRAKEIDLHRDRIKDFSKKLNNAVEQFQKMGKIAEEQFDGHKKALKYCASISEGTSPNPFNDCLEILKEADDLAEKYGHKIEKKVLTPLKNFIESIAVLEKRVKILDDRKKALKSAEEKYQSMSKKPKDKQIGMADLKVTYMNARDSYDYLADELLVDIPKALPVVQQNFAQVCAVFMKCYSKYMKKLDKVWEKLEDYSEKLNVGDLDKKIDLTPTDDSMVGEPNVQKRRDEEIARGTYIKIE